MEELRRSAESQEEKEERGEQENREETHAGADHGVRVCVPGGEYASGKGDC